MDLLWYFKLDLFEDPKLIQDNEESIVLTQKLLNDVRGYNNEGIFSLVKYFLFVTGKVIQEEVEINGEILQSNKTETKTTILKTVDIKDLIGKYVKKKDYNCLIDIPRDLTEDEINKISEEVFYDFNINIEKLKESIFKYIESDEEDYIILFNNLFKETNVNKLKLIKNFFKKKFVSESVVETVSLIKKYFKNDQGLIFETESLEDLIVSISNTPLLIDILQDKYVEKIPVIRGRDMKSRLFSTVNAILWFKKELRDNKFSKKDIEELKNLAKNDLRSSLAVPGTSVGILVGESLGSMNTQATLNTFHSSGQDTSATMNTNSYGDILGASENPNNININLAFKNKLITFEEAYKKRGEIIETRIKNILVKDSTNQVEIEKLDQIGGFQWWHNYQGVKSLKEEEYVLRIKFDINKLYANNITLKYIANKIEEVENVLSKNLEKDLSVETIKVFYSPTHEGIIDIYPMREVILSIMRERYPCDENPDSCIELFLKIFLFDQLKNILIKGVEGVIGLFPQIEPVNQVILYEKNINDPSIETITLDEDVDDPDKLWVIYLNKNRMRMTGIKPENLSYLFSLVGIETKLINVEKNYLVIYNPYDKKPTTMVLDRIKQDKDKIKKDIREKREKGIRGYIKMERTQLMSAAEYIYLILRVEPKSKNVLNKLMCFKFTDQSHTYSNNSHELTRILGIEAAYNYIYNTLNTISSDVGGANKRHIDLTAQFITRNGKPKGLKTPENSSGFFSRATFSKAATTLSSSAIMGDKENLTNPSTAIATGQLVKMGNGYLNKEPKKNNDDFFDVEEENIGDEEFMNENNFVLNTADAQAQLISTLKESEMIKFKPLAGYRPEFSDLKKDTIVDNIPSFIATKSQNLNNYFEHIVMFLENNSEYKLSKDESNEEIIINLPEKTIRKVLEDVVVLNIEKEEKDEREKDEVEEIKDVLDMFS